MEIFTYHVIDPFKVCNSVAFSTFTNTGNHHPGPFLELFFFFLIPTKRNPVPFNYPLGFSSWPPQLALSKQ